MSDCKQCASLKIHKDALASQLGKLWLELTQQTERVRELEGALETTLNVLERAGRHGVVDQLKSLLQTRQESHKASASADRDRGFRMVETSPTPPSPTDPGFSTSKERCAATEHKWKDITDRDTHCLVCGARPTAAEAIEAVNALKAQTAEQAAKQWADLEIRQSLPAGNYYPQPLMLAFIAGAAWRDRTAPAPTDKQCPRCERPYRFEEEARARLCGVCVSELTGPSHEDVLKLRAELARKTGKYPIHCCACQPVSTCTVCTEKAPAVPQGRRGFDEYVRDLAKFVFRMQGDRVEQVGGPMLEDGEHEFICLGPATARPERKDTD